MMAGSVAIRVMTHSTVTEQSNNDKGLSGYDWFNVS